ncbi:MAG: NADH-quinone oxidoreductase subunit NuoK [Verrucomicrobiae bacterium]|nr:NADH-quinone oxidoreductase subunit NuoK [Verrucomicrobiae bacterium]
MNPLHPYLMIAAALFAIGFAGAVLRRNAIIMLMGIELMLNAANLSFLAFARHHVPEHQIGGILLVLFSMAIAAAEAGVGLALIILVYRHFKTTDLDQVSTLRG